MSRIWLTSFAVIVMAWSMAGVGVARAEESTIKQDARQVGHEFGAAARKVGQGAKKAGKAVGHAAKEGAQAVKEGGKEFAKAVKGEGGK